MYLNYPIFLAVTLLFFLAGWLLFHRTDRKNIKFLLTFVIIVLTGFFLLWTYEFLIKTPAIADDFRISRRISALNQLEISLDVVKDKNHQYPMNLEDLSSSLALPGTLEELETWLTYFVLQNGQDYRIIFTLDPEAKIYEINSQNKFSDLEIAKCFRAHNAPDCLYSARDALETP